MQHPNKLNEILEGLEIKDFKPSDDLLLQLGGISQKRFTMILRNQGADLMASEKSGIENWLWLVTGLKLDIYVDGFEKIERKLKGMEV